MTKENGKVMVGSMVAALGPVTGTLTMAEILSGATAQAAKDEPAVVTKPLPKK
jgi:hypothetical protein